MERPPDGIINWLDVRKPVYEPTAAYGHFGRDEIKATWEKLDRVSELQKSIGLKATA